MNIILAGGSGLIGQSLANYLLARGDRVWVLTRTPADTPLPVGAQAVGWDGRTAQGWGHLVGEADAIINLSGANIGARPWTNERKRLLRSSRVESGQAIVEALRGSDHKPEVVVQIAGVGYYGVHGAEVLDETSPGGEDFLAGIGVDWERAIQPAAEMINRMVILRTGVVLTPKGGVLEPFILQNRLFAGGPLGSGKQWISWIHIHDLIRVFDFVLGRADAKGVFNATSPQPLTNADFGHVVARVMHRPFWAPAPAFALKLVLGELSSLVLQGQRVVPRRLLEMGFQFEFGDLQLALEDLLRQRTAA